MGTGRIQHGHGAQKMDTGRIQNGHMVEVCGGTPHPVARSLPVQLKCRLGFFWSLLGNAAGLVISQGNNYGNTTD
jgi:hypothetical protein